ncbi:glycosyltransferase family 4 protein [Enterococcus dongliensis]|uniref:glycosyltransferase family 4 protein n=1 Tax=Enterococcus dongliensis TaxID=2559925 RepID=UPI00288FD272|nr:glycosyltransferase family 4 protein [Enterococcus dongliensis]MDT2612643.1 glycosyltransferase family 4 protein [Enterococcus dongliensis]
MRVLYIMNNVDQGGAALAFKDMIDEVLDNHPEITPIILLAKNNTLASYFEKKGVEIHVINFNNFLTTERHPKILWKVVLLSRYLLAKRNFFKTVENRLKIASIDLIHSNLDRFDIGAQLAKKYTLPHVWHIREHGDDFNLQNLLLTDAIKHMNSFHSHFIAISQSVLNKWKEYGIENITLVYDGINATTYPGNLQKSAKVRILFLGGITKTKGQDRFFKIIATLPPETLAKIQIDFIGNGPSHYIQFLKMKYRQLSDVFMFYPYKNDILKQVGQYDIGVNASFMEGFGRVTAEYLEQGLFVMGSASGASPEIITDDKLGWLIDFSDAPQANALKLKEIIDTEVYKLDRAYRIEYIRENFSIKKHVNNVLTVYKQVSENNYDQSI